MRLETGELGLLHSVTTNNKYANVGIVSSYYPSVTARPSLI